MDPVIHMGQDAPVLRWGGPAGFAGGVLLLLVFVFVGAVVGPDPAGTAGPVSRFPDISMARTLENALYLVVMALWMVHVVALARALRGVHPALALSGGVLGVAGLTILAAGALPHVVTSRLSDLYHAPGASPRDQATVALIWQANQGIFDALLAVGLVLLPVGLAALGLAMIKAPGFGRRLGGTIVALGVTGLVAASAFVLDPRSTIVVVAFFALIATHLLAGWRAWRLSGAHRLASASLAARRVADGGAQA